MNKLSISSIEISNFGSVSQKSLQTNDKSIILIYGENEAGKSTIFNFIRNTLSGYPNLNRKDYSHFQIPNNAEFNSKLRVKLNNQEFVLFREPKAGKQISIEKISNIEISKEEIGTIITQLNIINPEEYKSVFGFNINELSSLNFLDDSSLGEKLITTAISGENDIFERTSNILSQDHESLIRKKSNSKNLGILESLNNQIRILKEKLRNLEIAKNNSKILILKLEELETSIIDSKQNLSRLKEEIKSHDNFLSNEKLYMELSEIKKIVDKNSTIRYLSESEEDNYKRHVLELEVLNESLINLTKRLDELEKERNNKNDLISHIIEELDLISNKKNVLSIATYSIFFALLILTYVIFYLLPFNSLLVTTLTIPLFLLIYFAVKLRKTNFKLIPLREKLNNLEDTILVLNSKIEEFSENLKSIKNDIDTKSRTLFSQLSFLNPQSNELSSLLDLIAFNCRGREESARVFNREEKLFKELGIENYDTLESSLSKISNFKTERNLLEIKFRKIEDEVNLKSTEKGRIMSEIGMAPTEDEISELETDIQRLKEEGSRLLSIWRRDKLSEYLLKQAYDNLSNVHVKEIFELSSQFFSEMTNNKYSNIKQTKNKKSIIVSSDLNNLEFTLEKLSRGTIEQLYLSLRLALIERYSRINMSFPVLFDDVLVNFDESRTINTIKCLNGISNTSQIFLFTCHKWIKDIFENTVEDGCVIEI